MGRNKKIFALYRGDDLITSGTIDEIAAKRGLSPDTIRHYCRPAYRRRTSENAYRCVAVE